jgi:hypothetical protein
MNNNLYKVSLTGPLLHCLSKNEGKELLSEIHTDISRGHIGSWALAAKVLKQGFYWPSVVDDTSKIMATCEACQKFSPQSRTPPQPSRLITPSWPLQRWGIDIVGPLPTTQGNFQYAVVAVEYFTKWIEVKPLINITSITIKRFFWQNIICRFGVAKEIIVDNAKQFDSNLFKEFCYQIGTEVAFASVYHPQSNGAVERANTLIFTSIKKVLRGPNEGKMGWRIVEGRLESQHISF